MKIKNGFFLVLSILLFSASPLVFAADADADAQDKIKNSLAVLLPGVVPDSITRTPMNGIYEIIFGPRLVYMSADGKYLLQGSIIDLETRENLTEPRLMEAKIEAIKNVGENNMIIYSPPKGTPVKHQVNVFTDIDCGYCRKLHSEMADYNKAGIEIRYLFYPRSGKDTESYFKAVRVWCSSDRRAAMDQAKAGKDIEADTSCENPVDDHLLLGSLIGVTGTPAMVLNDGKLVPGYVPADRLIQVLDARKAAQN
jgi:thiol:disulfide interchange protein DsbC